MVFNLDYVYKLSIRCEGKKIKYTFRHISSQNKVVLCTLSQYYAKVMSYNKIREKDEMSIFPNRG